MKALGVLVTLVLAGIIVSVVVNARREAQSAARTDAVIAFNQNKIPSQLGTTQNDLFNFYCNEQSEGKLDDQANLAWGKLVNAMHRPTFSNPTASDFLSAEVSRGTLEYYVRLKRSRKRDDLRVSPEDLVSIQTHWSIQDREQYWKLLRRAADIMESDDSKTSEAAYEEARQEFSQKGHPLKPIPSYSMTGEETTAQPLRLNCPTNSER